MTYDHVLGFALEHPWAVTEGMRAIIAGILARRIVGQDVDPAELAALTPRKNLPQPQKGGAVAVIPIYGVIAPRMNMLSDISGGTTFEQLTGQLHAAVENPDVKTIIFDVDSPGGNVAGATEFAAEILKARALKPIIAQANHLMASAAYWPMACATQIVATPSSLVGAVGVYTIHDDVSEAMAKLGVKREVIGAGKFKTEGIGGGPLSDEARAHLQGVIEGAYGRFVGDIAKGRGVAPSAVRGGFGEGRVIEARAALDLGMVDRIGTLADTLARVMHTAPAALRASVSDPAALGTSQEPPLAAAVTDQDRAQAARWARDAELALLDW